MTSLKELLGITEKKAPEAIPIDEYFRDWKTYGKNAAGRLLAAFGTPQLVDTSKDERLGRIFANRTLKVYPAFHDFFGIEETIMECAQHLQSGADGLIAGRQIQLYYGPPGSGKSSFATRLRDLAEEGYMAVLAYKPDSGPIEHSPVFESPLGLFQPARYQAILRDKFGIPPGRFDAPMSPWAAAKLDLNGGDPTRFYVKLIPPSQARSIGIAKVAPGNSREGDVTAFIGIGGSQPTIDGYAYIGGLNRTTQGLLEIVEMFGAKLANLEPLIGATQDCSYASSGVGEYPYQGVIIAHANEEPWTEFKGKSQNSALVSRIREIAFPLCVRATEIARIHEKYLSQSEHAKAPRTPGALEFMAVATALTRVYGPSMTRVLAYDGRTPPSGREQEWSIPVLRAKAREELKKEKRPGEGMGGLDGRADFAILDRVMVSDPEEVGLDEVGILNALIGVENVRGIATLSGTPFKKVIDEFLKSRLVERVRAEITHAFVEKHDDVMSSAAARYYGHADAWIEGLDVKDPETGSVQGREWIDQELSKVERPAGIRNPKDFRYELVKAVLRHRSSRGEAAPVWDALNDEQKAPFERIASSDAPKKDGEKNADEDMLAIIAFGPKKSKELEEKHEAFVARMVAQGYTKRQVRRFVETLLEYEAAKKLAQHRR